MKMVAANVGRACFSFQSTNQTRRYCSRKFKADRGENTSSSKKCMERSIHHYYLIAKNAVETSVAQAAQKVNQFFFFLLFFSRLQLLNQTALLLLTQSGPVTEVKLVLGGVQDSFLCVITVILKIGEEDKGDQGHSSLSSINCCQLSTHAVICVQ